MTRVTLETHWCPGHGEVPLNVVHPALAAALTVLALSAGPARAAAVSANDCVQGGGVIIVSAVEGGTDSFTQRCVGGLHDGETIT